MSEIKKVDAEIIAKELNVPQYDKIIASTIEEQEAAIKENIVGELEEEEEEAEEEDQDPKE